MDRSKITMAQQPHSPSQSGVPTPAQSPPAEDVKPGVPYGSILYSATFTDSVMEYIVSPNSSSLGKTSGVRILGPESSQEPEPGASVRLADIDASSLPDLPSESLPLALDDPRRVYASPIEGILLTHPGGWIEGGTGPTLYPDPEPAAQKTPDFAKNFLLKHNIRTPNQLHNHLRREMQSQREELRRRMQARQEAHEHNAKVEKDLQRLIMSRNMERKIEELKRTAKKDKKG